MMSVSSCRDAPMQASHREPRVIEAQRATREQSAPAPYYLPPFRTVVASGKKIPGFIFKAAATDSQIDSRPAIPTPNTMSP